MASLGCAAWPVASATCHIVWLTFGNGCAQLKKMSSRSWPLPFASPSLQLIETHQQQAAWSESKNKLLQFKSFNNQPWSIPSLCLQKIPLAQHQKQTTCSFPLPREKKNGSKLGSSPATSEEFAEFLRGESCTLDLVTWYAIHNPSEYHPKEFAHVKEATTKKNFTTTQYCFLLLVHVISKNQPKKPTVCH